MGVVCPRSPKVNQQSLPSRTRLGRFALKPGGGVLPYMGYIGMCGPKGYGFSAVLVINRVSIIAILPPLW